MYNDYQVAYETNLNEFLVPIIIGIVLLIIMLIVIFISLMKIYKKANRSGIAALIPIYNLIILMEIVNKPKWQAVLFLIPFVNLVVYAQAYYKLAKNFRKLDSFAILTIVLPMVFLPMIAFSDSEYIGIDNDALTGESIAIDIPQITEEEQIATEADKVKESTPLDISIGGGVYQKDYEENLLNVSDDKIESTVLANFKVKEENPIPIQEVKEKVGADLFKEIDFIDKVSETNLESSVQNNLETDTQITNAPQIEPVKIVEEAIIPEIKPLEAAVPLINQEPVIQKLDPIESLDTSNQVLNTKENNVNTTNTGLEYISCPQCGAKLKSDTKKCFMCGKDL